ncbi:hypothetical protein BDN72DRAFT_838638 [Pluteus cervinus]|uniref:Uncharacterized protein n=1 Tax=Pluteus cervinus TaxID=181527 RepID=A0ACD3AY80_9AGAR|nr:hypothetical protein BDN72DRAFT_838638 [Pluteus cervinus]
MVQKSIYIIGPSSTGKTTLCQALVRKLGLSEKAVVAEVARDVIKARGWTRDDVGKLELQEAILEAHIAQETRIREDGLDTVQLCDRSAVDPIVYAALLAANDTDVHTRTSFLIKKPEFQQVLDHYRQSVFVLLGPVPEWQVDDGVRLIYNQEGCFEWFRRILTRLEIPFRVVGQEMRNLEERVVAVIGFARL